MLNGAGDGESRVTPQMPTRETFDLARHPAHRACLPTGPDSKAPVTEMTASCGE